MQKVSCAILHPTPEGVSIEAALVLFSLEGIAAELGVEASKLRWIKHARTVFIGTATGSLFTDTFCPVHQIVMRGRTLQFFLENETIGFCFDEPENIHELTEANITALARHNHLILGEPETGDGYELRPMIEPLFDCDQDFQVGNLGNVLGRMAADEAQPNVIEVSSMEDLKNFFAQITSEQTKNETLVLEQAHFTSPTSFPSAVEVAFEVIKNWLNALQDNPRKRFAQKEHYDLHRQLGLDLLDVLEDFIDKQREVLAKLGTKVGEYEGSLTLEREED